MKKIFFILSLLSLSLLFGCKEEEGIVSDFDIKLAIPAARAVHQKEFSFEVESNRKWKIVGASLSASEFKFDEVLSNAYEDTQFLSSAITYPTGTTTFTVPAKEVNISATHKLKLTLDVKDAETGAVKTLAAYCPAYMKNEMQLVIETPVVRKGQPFKFYIHSNTAEYFVLENADFDLALFDSENGLVVGKKYFFDQNGNVSFNIPTRYANVFINKEAKINVTDDTGEMIELVADKTFTYITLSAEINSDHTSMFMSSTENAHGNTAKLMIYSSDLVKYEVYSTDNSLYFATDKDFKSLEQQKEDKEKFIFSGSGNQTLYVRGDIKSGSGKKRIIIHPTVTEFEDADTTLNVVVKPAVYLAVGGDLSYTPKNGLNQPSLRNPVMYMKYTTTKLKGDSDRPVPTYSFHNYAPAGGWAGAPNSITCKFYNVINDAVLNSSDQYKINTENHKSLLASGSINGTNYAIESDETIPGIATDPQGRYYDLNEIENVLGNDFFSDANMFTSNEKYNVTLQLLSEKPSNTNTNKYFWYNRNDYKIGAVIPGTEKEVIYPTGNLEEKKNISINDSFCSLSSRTISANPLSYFTNLSSDTVGGDNYCYRYVWLYSNPSYSAKTTVRPYTLSIISTNSTLLKFLNEYNDCVIADHGASYVYYLHNSLLFPEKEVKDYSCAVPVSGNIKESDWHRTEWKKITLKVKTLEYDFSKIDLIGIIYSFPIVNTSNSTFYNGGDYWWHSVDGAPLWVPLYGNQTAVAVKDTNN